MGGLWFYMEVSMIKEIMEFIAKADPEVGAGILKEYERQQAQNHSGDRYHDEVYQSIPDANAGCLGAVVVIVLIGMNIFSYITGHVI